MFYASRMSYYFSQKILGNYYYDNKILRAIQKIAFGLWNITIGIIAQIIDIITYYLQLVIDFIRYLLDKNADIVPLNNSEISIKIGKDWPNKSWKRYLKSDPKDISIFKVRYLYCSKNCNIMLSDDNYITNILKYIILIPLCLVLDTILLPIYLISSGFRAIFAEECLNYRCPTKDKIKIIYNLGAYEPGKFLSKNYPFTRQMGWGDKLLNQDHKEICIK